MEKNNDFENEKNTVFDSEEEAKSDDNKDAENIKGGTEKDSEVAEEKEKDNETQKTDPSEEEKDSCEDSKDHDLNSPKYSSNYVPPYYVPKYSDSSGAGASHHTGAASSHASKKKYSIGIVAVMCVVCLLLSATIGAIAGAIASGAVNLSGSANGDSENVTIIKSDREITVSEIPGSTGYSDLTVAQVAALVGNSVVEITTTHVQTNNYYGQYITSGAGSGVIFSQDGNTGHIVTNYHVIEDADEISVRVKKDDGYSDYKATYIAGDEGEDIAVIRITVENGVTLSKAVFGDSEKIVVGEEVVAIGNPLGQLGGTVTDGIISALDREITIGDYTMVLLQTNAAINPGNSGGGLFNMAGELVGIVNAKQSSTGIEGLGFAIPSNRVADNINDILTLGYISGRNTLGINVQYARNSAGKEGVYVMESSGNFRYGDLIVKIGDYDIATMNDYNNALKNLSAGDSVNVRVARNGYYETITVTVKENTSKE